MTAMTDLAVPAPAQLMEFFTAKWLAPVIGALADLGIADLVADGPRTPEELAKNTGAHPRSLYRILRAAASRGVFAEDGRVGPTGGIEEASPCADC
jgi:hypothetical protein